MILLSSILQAKLLTMSASVKSKKVNVISPPAPAPISRSVVSSDDEDDKSDADVAGPSRGVGDVDSSEIDEDGEDDESELPDMMDVVERAVGGKGRRKEYS